MNFSTHNRKPKTPNLIGCRGMTFVEMLVVLSLFSVLSISIMNSVAYFYDYNAYTISQAYQVDHARRGVEYLVRDLREMIFADDGAFPLVAKGTSTVTFYSDIDRDNSVELVYYHLDGTTLYKDIYNASGSPPIYSSSTADETITISEYVQNNIQEVPILTYYDESGAIASSSASVTDIRYIEVALIINIDPIKDPGEFMLRSSAALRNLKEYGD